MKTTMCNRYLPNLTESSSALAGPTTFWCSSSVFGIRHYQSLYYEGCFNETSACRLTKINTRERE